MKREFEWNPERMIKATSEIAEVLHKNGLTVLEGSMVLLNVHHVMVKTFELEKAKEEVKKGFKEIMEEMMKECQ